MPPSTVTWSLGPHTNGKHLVLKKYMQAWLPIMTRWNESVLFVDGFAGPGEYSGGEPGSPLIVLEALASHKYRDNMNASIRFLFIEQEEARATHLRDTIERQAFALPPTSRCDVISLPFDEAISQELDSTILARRPLPPAFVMIDPFGVAGVKMSTIARLLENPRTEVYVSFMYEPMTRFIDHQNFEPHLDELFGSDNWRGARGISDPDARRAFLFDLFTHQLMAAGAAQVVHFELYEGNRLVYAIFFGTNSLEGCDKMKRAIWDVTDSSPYRFRGQNTAQMSFGEQLTDLTPFATELRNTFSPQGVVRIEDVVNFAKSAATIFHTGHLKQKTLTPMEKRGELSVVTSPRKRNSGYPERHDAQVHSTIGMTHAQPIRRPSMHCVLRGACQECSRWLRVIHRDVGPHPSQRCWLLASVGCRARI